MPPLISSSWTGAFEDEKGNLGGSSTKWAVFVDEIPGRPSTGSGTARNDGRVLLRPHYWPLMLLSRDFGPAPAAK